MAAPCYIAWNGATGALTAALAGVGVTTIKTMLQIKPGTPKIRIVEWGYSFETAPTAMVKVELIETGTVNATVSTTSFVIHPYNDVTGPASQATIATSGSGYTATAEGSITASRLLAYQEELGTEFKQQFPLGREPEINGGNILRIRATTSSSVNMSTYVIWEE